MSARHGILGVAIVAIVLVALSFAGVGSDLTTGIFWNIDGLLLLSVCLMTVVVFGTMLYFVFKKSKAEAEASAAAAKAAPAAAARPAAPPSASVVKPAAPSSAANPPQTAPQK